MKFGSVCSGIEAASVAWHPLGWRAAWLAEVEPFPSAVLAHHYPDVTNLGDMTTLPELIALGHVEAPDVFCGGTPCQAFSVAGLRKSLDDARGNLSLTFCEIANAIDLSRAHDNLKPCIVFWENVPGVLNTKDNAFGCFLAGLAGEDEPLVAPGGKWPNAGVVYGPERTVAWRVLDAQYFGVAQRRRRVFVVASAREGFDPAAVLFEFDGVRRDTAPSRQAREGVAGGVEIGPSGGRLTELNPTLDTRAKDGPIRNQLAGAVMQSFALQHAQIGRKDSAGPQGKGWQADVAFTQDSRSCADAVAIVPATTHTLRGEGFDANHGHSHLVAFGGNNTAGPINQAAALNANRGCHNPGDFEAGTLLVQGVTHSLRGEGFDASEDGTARGTPLVPVAFQSSQTGVRLSDTHATLDANNGPRRHNGVLAPITFSSVQSNQPINAGLQVSQTLEAKNPMAVAFQQTADCLTAAYGTKWNGNASATNGSLFAAQAVALQDVRAMDKAQNGRGWNDDGTSYTVDTHATQGVATAMQVRRLTPVECERLQGFPDNYTAIPWRKKPASECPDGPRYKALGNSWAVPVVRWIGWRIVAQVYGDLA